MAHVSHKLKNAFQGALAGGGDPATSPLYVFGPFLALIVGAGVADVTFGASVWLVVATVVLVSAMYRLVMRWVVDGSGGSGLTEEEFGPWAVKVNAGITFVEYTLTFLVSLAALVTFVADRLPALNGTVAGLPLRTGLAILLSLGIGALVNRGPRTAARAFGPATFAVLLLLWTMIGATIWRRGFHLPQLDLQAFTSPYLHFTLGGYARILALMTGVEIFANLVAAYDGTAGERGRKAFGSLAIIMGTTALTMLIVGPAILALADPSDPAVSVFTQTMDRLLPAPLPMIGTLIGVLVLASAAAASAQGIQNLALGLRYRHYLPAWLGARNNYDVAATPVWVEILIVAACFLLFGTHEETYLAIYAAGVFILLSMTGWAAAKRLLRQLRVERGAVTAVTLAGTAMAALLTTGATLIIFEERFRDGAWTYLLFIPVLYACFGYFRRRLGAPKALEEHLGRFFSAQYLLPSERGTAAEEPFHIGRILVPLDGTTLAEQALPIAEHLARTTGATLDLISVRPDEEVPLEREDRIRSAPALYLARLTTLLSARNVAVEHTLARGTDVPVEIGHQGILRHADLIVMATHGPTRVDRILRRSTAVAVVRQTTLPVLVIRPTDAWTSRHTAFARLLVCLDGSVDSEEVLLSARVLARHFHSRIVLLAVPEVEDEAPRLREYLRTVARALSALGIGAESQVTGTVAARTIVEVAEAARCDLIMLTTRGRGAPEEIDVEVGNVAEQVSSSAPCPVYIVTVAGSGREDAA